METPKQKAEYQPSEEEREAIKESIRLHNEDIKNKRKETPESGAQKSDTNKTEYSDIFSNDQNKENFEKLSDSAKKLLAGVYNNVAIGFIDRIRVARSNKLYSFYKNKTEKIENELEFKKRSIKQIKADIDTHDLRMTKMSDQFGGLTAKAGREALKERNKFKKMFRDANYEENELVIEKISNEKKLKKYEEKRNKIIERIEKFVEEKTEPHKEKIKELNGDVEMLDGEIKLFISKKDEIKNILNKLQEEADNLQKSKMGMFESERITYTEKMKEVYAEFSKMDDIIKSREEEKDNINTKIGKLENKIDYWNNVVKKAKTDNMPRYEQPANDSKEKIAPKEKVKETEKERVSPTSGDEVLWESQGVLQWKEPKRIIHIQEDPKSKRKYAFFENIRTGIPLDELISAKKENTSAVNNIEERFDEHYDDINIENEKGIEENLDNKEISPNKYISKWNGLSKIKDFMNIPKLDKKEILNILNIKNSKTLRLRVMEEAITEYNKLFSKVSESKLKRIFKLIRNAESLNK